MIKKQIKISLKDIPVYEHLDVCLKTTYAQRLQWLEDANEFFRLGQEARKKMLKQQKKTKAKKKKK